MEKTLFMVHARIEQRCVLVIVGLALTITSYAQWNIKGGLDLSSLTSSSDVKSEMGFHLGVGYDVPLSSKFYFQPGILFASNGFDFKSTCIVEKASVSMYALEIPLDFSFRPQISNNIKLVTEFGMFVRYGLFGNKKYIFTDSEMLKESSFQTYNRFDTGANLGIGLAYDNLALICFYQFGFLNVEKAIDKLKHKKIRLSINYMF